MNELPHPFDDQRYIGTVTQVGPSSVRANLPTAGDSGSRLHHGLRVAGGEVGEFVVVECDELAVFGRVLDVRLPERERLTVEPSLGSHGDLHPVGSIQLLATIDLSATKALPGISRYPRLGSRIYSAHPELVRWLIADSGRTKDNPHVVELSFACLTDDHAVTLGVTPEQVFGRHCAVLGTTGGGKSWTVARLLEEAIRHKSKLILLDATGEFWRLEDEAVRHVTIGEGPCLPDSAEKVAFPHSDMIESDLFALFRPNSQSQGPKLREAIRSLRLMQRCDDMADENGNLIKRGARREPVEAAFAEQAEYVESPRSFFSIDVLAKQIREECIWPYARNSDSRYGDVNQQDEAYCLTLMMRIESITASADYACVFKTEGMTTVAGAIDDFIADGSARLLRISLQNVPFGNHARELVANGIGRVLLDKARDGCFREQPLVVFLDEAHQFLNRAIGDDYLKVELDAFGLVAKEGRKYGLSICLATQRPRDIPQDVLSQMGTLIVHRLINDRDREVVERAAGEIDRSAAAFLPTLGPGEAIVIGVDIPVPMAIQVRKPQAKPDSQGPNYQVCWSHPKTIDASSFPNEDFGIVSVSDFEEGEYELPDGETADGVTCRLTFDDDSSFDVGEGTVFTCSEVEWEVTDVDEASESITIKRV